MRSSGVKRHLVVGGAGSREVSSGKPLIDQTDLPAAYKPKAVKRRGSRSAERRKRARLDVLSPSALFVKGEPTGKFRLGNDALLTNDKSSSISFEDYAAALVD